MIKYIRIHSGAPSPGHDLLLAPEQDGPMDEADLVLLAEVLQNTDDPELAESVQSILARHGWDVSSTD